MARPTSDASAPRLAQTYDEVEDALLSRWPETRIDPTLDRIRDFLALLGDPQDGYPVVHLTGTNGKTSTARMIEGLVRALGLRTGRFTSPHLESMTERIVVDGEPLSEDQFVAAFNDIAPYTHLVDAQHSHPLSFFETVTAMAYATFADAPVDAAVVEVGLGGTWDSTNVADGKVAVITPIAVDHAKYLGSTPAEIARDKAGIIKPGATVVTAVQDEDVALVLGERCAEVGATLAREGLEFGVTTRVPAVGGQLLTLQGLRASYDEVFLPLYGAHQAQNAALALAAVEAFVGGGDALDAEVVREAFAEVTSPGRLEVIRRSPTIVLDAAHNPHGAHGGGRGDRGLVRVRPADRRPRGDGRQGPRGPARQPSSRCSPTSSAPRTPPTARCRPPTWPRWRWGSSDRTACPSRRCWPTRSTRRRHWPRPAVCSGRRSARARCW